MSCERGIQMWGLVSQTKESQPAVQPLVYVTLHEALKKRIPKQLSMYIMRVYDKSSNKAGEKLVVIKSLKSSILPFHPRIQNKIGPSVCSTPFRTITNKLWLMPHRKQYRYIQQCRLGVPWRSKSQMCSGSFTSLCLDHNIKCTHNRKWWTAVETKHKNTNKTSKQYLSLNLEGSYKSRILCVLRFQQTSFGTDGTLLKSVVSWYTTLTQNWVLHVHCQVMIDETDTRRPKVTAYAWYIHLSIWWKITHFMQQSIVIQIFNFFFFFNTKVMFT